MVNPERITVIFCDLDGTYVLDNSFHGVMAQAWLAGSAAQRVGLACALALRGLGRFSGGHAGMKKRVLRWMSKQSAAFQAQVQDATLAQLQKTVSDPIRATLEQWRAQGATLILATAAPDLYARALARQAGFTQCIATSSTVTSDWHEMLADRKAAACTAWLAQNMPDQTPHVVVLTDHPDDLPLLALADEAVLQSADDHYTRIVQGLPSPAPKLRRIDPVAAQENGGIWLWFDGRPVGPLDLWEVRTILSKHRYGALYIGDGRWRRVQPGDKLTDPVKRVDCPLPPSSRMRLKLYIYRRVLRDGLGIFH